MIWWLLEVEVEFKKETDEHVLVVFEVAVEF